MKKNAKKYLISAILLIAIVCAATFAGCAGAAKSAEVDLNFDGLGSKPNAEASAKATPVDKSRIVESAEQTSDAEVLASIKYLIQLSNQNHIDADFYATAAYGTGDAAIKFGKENIIGTMDVRDWRIYDNGDYFFDSYGLVVGGYTVKADGSKGKVADAILSAVSGVLNYTKRIYSPDSDTFYVSKNGKASKDSFALYPSLDAISYAKPKSEKMTEQKFLEYNYCKTSFKEYTSENFDIENSITKGSLTYNAEEGVYYISCDINCEDERVLDLSIKSMKESCGSDIFRYDSKHLDLQIWDCGLMRRYYNTNVWVATLLPTTLKVQGSSDSMYEQLFTYNKDGLDKLSVTDEIKQAMMK